MAETPTDDLLKHLATRIGERVKTSTLATTLTAYVTNSSLTSTLSSYVTNSALVTTLESYVTNSSLIPDGPITITETAEGIKIGSTATGGGPTVAPVVPRVMAYTMPGWGDTPDTTPWDALTDVFLHVSPGVVTPGTGAVARAWSYDGNLGSMQWATDMAAKAKSLGKAVHLSVAGDSTYMLPALRSNMTALVNNLIALANETGAFGISIDYEPIQTAEELTLLRQFGEALSGKGFETSICAGQYNSAFPEYTDDKGCFKAWDYVNSMTYDMSWPFGDQKAWHNSPLYGESRYLPYSVDFNTRTLIGFGVAPEAIRIGVGSYVMAANGPKAPGDAWGTKVGVADTWAMDKFWTDYAPLMTEAFDMTARVPYWYAASPVGAQQITYASGENKRSLIEKAGYTRAGGLDGVILWMLPYSHTFAEMLMDAFKRTRAHTLPAPAAPVLDYRGRLVLPTSLGVDHWTMDGVAITTGDVLPTGKTVVPVPRLGASWQGSVPAIATSLKLSTGGATLQSSWSSSGSATVTTPAGGPFQLAGATSAVQTWLDPAQASTTYTIVATLTKGSAKIVVGEYTSDWATFNGETASSYQSGVVVLRVTTKAATGVMSIDVMGEDGNPATLVGVSVRTV